MLNYNEILDYNKKCCERYLVKYQRIHETPSRDTVKTTIKGANKEAILGVLPQGNTNAGNIGNDCISTGFSVIPGTIRELLKIFEERRVKIVLEARQNPEIIEIEAIVGDILVAETEERKFKFIDIKCICEVIIDREELLESILSL